MLWENAPAASGNASAAPASSRTPRVAPPSSGNPSAAAGPLGSHTVSKGSKLRQGRHHRTDTDVPGNDLVLSLLLCLVLITPTETGTPRLNDTLILWSHFCLSPFKIYVQPGLLLHSRHVYPATGLLVLSTWRSDRSLKFNWSKPKLLTCPRPPWPQTCCTQLCPSWQTGNGQ